MKSKTHERNNSCYVIAEDDLAIKRNRPGAKKDAKVALYFLVSIIPLEREASIKILQMFAKKNLIWNEKEMKN